MNMLTCYEQSCGKLIYTMRACIRCKHSAVVITFVCLFFVVRLMKYTVLLIEYSFMFYYRKNLKAIFFYDCVSRNKS